ncbi:hypothetical protein POL68_23590 [Stigmatella sp. ncwal1]|uniref:Immunity MXAN-0049 protein domain-containing protein n=1 Tax=Stigmatella ashevillensis TaxID=2995309 RepID=A0ABT5DCR3_9BACT|nr:DUF1629 domain-containing protein [Stigmatella ashevillena]MDC0711475.1 hypothetical protein [Stigmatella ashevillena]
MPERYFRLMDDVSIPGRWELGVPVDQQGREVDDPWMFKNGVPVCIDGRLKVPIQLPGKALDYSLAGIGVAPIIHVRAASLLKELAPNDVQLFPVDINGQPDQFYILNATRVKKCIDDEASEEVTYWAAEDGQPEKVGQYQGVHGMRIDPARVGNAWIFRTWGWTIALIVSEEIKEALERIRATGVKFREV